MYVLKLTSGVYLQIFVCHFPLHGYSCISYNYSQFILVHTEFAGVRIPDFWTPVLWIWIWPFLLNQDQFFGSRYGSWWHMIFSLYSWQNSKCFTFLKFQNLPIHSKVMIFFHWIQIFGQKIVIFCKLVQFSDVTLIFWDGIGQKKFTFWQKVPNFEGL